jgi:hypothetical protein
MKKLVACLLLVCLFVVGCGPDVKPAPKTSGATPSTSK